VHQILEITKSYGSFTAGLATLLGLATVAELGVVGPSLNGLRASSTVEPANFHPVCGGVEAATLVAFGSR